MGVEMKEKFTLVTFDERVYTKMVTRFTFRGYVVTLMGKEISFVRRGLYTNPRKILTILTNTIVIIILLT